MKLQPFILLTLFFAVISIYPSKLSAKIGKLSESNSELIYLNQERLEKVKVLIEKKNSYFTDAYDQLIEDADKYLVRLKDMFGALNKLSMAYFFSNDIKYANKAKSIIQI